VKAAEKRQIKAAVEAGEIQIVVGTHALIQDDVAFHNLGFAVIDEQHRFGVKQRKALMDKGKRAPDILLMTATPIPRTLALTFYGDLDISEIDSLPPGRIPPITKVFREEKLKDAYSYVASKLQAGDRAYFIYPAIDDSGKSKLKSATKSAEAVQKAFPDKKVGLLHGRMKADDKRHLLDDFASGALDILVSTTVVEVGVDVKDATVVVIENADHFGLAQLHQLRGRVGRNSKQSYCVLVASEELSDTGMKRLRAMEHHTSGFKLAEIDLELRGQGDFSGVRQSGMPEFQFADIIKDAELMREARTDAREITEDDPALQKPKNALIKAVLMQRWQDEYEYFLIG
jgi:ATP-dependent DNA helicase RecG